MKNDVDTQEQNHYELGYLLAPVIAEEAVGGEIGKIREAIVAVGTLNSATDPKLIPLAYSMEKVVNNKKSLYSSAYFGSMLFQTQSDSVESLMEVLKKNDSLVRFLLISRSKESLLPPKKRMIPEEKDKKEGGTLDVAALDREIEGLVVQ